MMKISTWVLGALLLSCHLANGQETLSQQKPERLFQTGLDLLLHQEYGSALSTFSAFLREHPQNNLQRADAEYYKALCALNLYHADGEKLLEDFVAAHPHFPKAVTAYYDLATFFYNEKNYTKTSSYFEKVDFPALGAEQQNTGRFRWGYSLFSQKKLKEALDQFNTIKGMGGQYGPAASYYAGFIEFTNGDYSNALIDLKRAEANAAYSTLVPVLIANVYFRQKNDDELLRYSEVVLAMDDVVSADVISLLTAETWFKKGAYAKALPMYRTYVDSHEPAISRIVLYQAGFAAFSVGDYDQALTYLKSSAAETDSVGVFAAYTLGLLYLQKQDKELALTAFETARAGKDPRLSEESLFMASKINYDLGRPDRAITEFEAFLNSYLQSTHALEVKEMLSQAYVNANNYNKAIEYIDALPRRTPSVDLAYQKATFLKGTELYNKEDFAQAVQYFEKSLQFPINSVVASEAGFWCAEAYSVGKRYEQAIPYYERALGFSPGPDLSKNIRYGLGYALYNLQQYSRALTNFSEFVSKATPAHPNYKDAVIRLADCYYAGKSYTEALSFYRKAIAMNSVDADYALLQAGIILAIQRRYREATSEFEWFGANQSSRYADDAVYQHAQVEFEQSNYRSAAELFSSLINSSRSARLLPYAYSRRGAANFNLKKFNETANDYIALLEKFPAHPAAQDLLLPLQEALNLANRSSEFDQFLARFKQLNPDAKGIESVEFESAKSLYFSQAYARSIDAFSRYITGYPESPRLSEAVYYEAESYYRLKDFPKALELYQLITDRSFEMRTKVLARVGELEFKQGRYENAAGVYHQLALVAANKKDQYTAWNGMMESYYLLAQYDSVDVFANRIMEQGSINVSAQNKASLYLGKSAMAKGDYETAKDEFLTTLNTARDEYGAEAKYRIGEIFYLTKEYGPCKETLFALNTDFASYQEWVGKSYLLLVDCFLATGEVFQAKGTLRSLIDNFPKQEVRDFAKEKLKAIEQDELKKQAMEKSDTTGNE